MPIPTYQPIVDIGPVVTAIATALSGSSEAALSGVAVLWGAEAPQDTQGKRISLNARAVPNHSYLEADAVVSLDIAVTTSGRDVTPTFAIAAALQRVLVPSTDPTYTYIAPTGYKPLREVVCTGIVPRDPPSEAGKTVRVLLVSFTIWAERA